MATVIAVLAIAIADEATAIAKAAIVIAGRACVIANAADAIAKQAIVKTKGALALFPDSSKSLRSFSISKRLWTAETLLLFKSQPHPSVPFLHLFRNSCVVFLAASGCFTSALTAQSLPVDAKPSKTFIDYFLPIPAQGALKSDAWGAPGVLPRDTANGLEDAANRYCYWDGQILRGADGKYCLFASRWDEAQGHGGWKNSVGVSAKSDHLLGPYLDRGLMWPDDHGGRGHNVTALKLPDGRYAVVVSETRQGDVFVSESLDGPWKHLGNIVTQGDVRKRASNYSVMVRPDGDFQIVPRSGQILISKTGILGPYLAQGPSVYPKVAGLEQRDLEDPVVWFSGGRYHIVVNSWSQRRAFHLTSKDGISGWTLRGVAYDPRVDFVRYTDGTVNRWDKLERPAVVIEDGHVVAVTLAVLDVPKDQEKGNDRHGNKIIVIPFDGAALDRDLENAPELPSESVAPSAPAK